MGRTSVITSERRINPFVPAVTDSAIAMAIKSTRGPIDRVCFVTSLEQLIKIYGDADPSDANYTLEKASYLVKRGNALQLFKMEEGGDKASVTLTFKAASGADPAVTLTLKAIGPGIGYNEYKAKVTKFADNLFSLLLTDANDNVLERYSCLSLNPVSPYFCGDLLAESLVANVDSVVGSEFTKSSTAFSGTFAGGTASTAKVDYSVLRDRDIAFCVLLSDNISASATSPAISLKGLVQERKDFEVLISANSNSISAITFGGDEEDSYLCRVSPLVTIPSLKSHDSAICVAEIIASLHRRNLVFKSPGGLDYGMLNDVLKVDERLTKEQIGNLQELGVNPVVAKTGYGSVLWGNYTSCISPVNVTDLATRLLANYLKRAAYRLSQQFIYREHTEFIWNQWKGAIEPVVRDIATAGGLNNYSVICDRSIMTEEDIANGILRGHITIYPIGYIQQIEITLFIDERGVTFE